MKRIISLFLAVSSFLTLLCSTAGAESSTGFADVPQTAWYYSYVMQMQKNGYMNGVSADQFDPDGHLTRAMVTTVLYRMEEPLYRRPTGHLVFRCHCLGGKQRCCERNG